MITISQLFFMCFCFFLGCEVWVWGVTCMCVWCVCVCACHFFIFYFLVTFWFVQVIPIFHQLCSILVFVSSTTVGFTITCLLLNVVKKMEIADRHFNTIDFSKVCFEITCTTIFPTSSGVPRYIWFQVIFIVSISDPCFCPEDSPIVTNMEIAAKHLKILLHIIE